MKTRCLLLIACLVALSAQADPPPGYYNAAMGLTGDALRHAVHGIIDGHTSIPYSHSTLIDASDALKVLDEDPEHIDEVVLVYSRRSELKSNYPNVWNKEHLWPNSYGLDDIMPAYSDLHNLRPADVGVNSARGNKFYDRGIVTALGYKKPGHAAAPDTTTDNDSWEPPAIIRGDIARALFYMDVRYEGDALAEPDLVLTDMLSSISTTGSVMGRLTTLLEWHYSDPVDFEERLRNDKVYSLYQGNRNPFVDHPEWVALIFQDVLETQFANGMLQFSWPKIYQDAELQWTDALPSGWTGVPVTPVGSGNQWQVILPTDSGRHFFRLAFP